MDHKMDSQPNAQQREKLPVEKPAPPAQKAKCGVCFRKCELAEGETGFCGGRSARGGKVISDSYGKLTAMLLDPIEKKPLARFYPGTRVLSVGTYGCNLRCPFCQNHEISMGGEEKVLIHASPRKLAQKALELKAKGNIGLAYTYNEPLTGWEYVRDCAKEARQLGLKNVLVSNGTADMEIIRRLTPLIDAANIDLKGFTQEYYDWLGGDLETVKETIAYMARRCHVEATALIVPGKNDDEASMSELARFLASLETASGEAVALHVTRFFPRYHAEDIGATPLETMVRLAEAARRYLPYVYLGNC